MGVYVYCTIFSATSPFILLKNNPSDSFNQASLTILESIFLTICS